MKLLVILLLITLMSGCNSTSVIIDPVITEDEVESGIDGFFRDGNIFLFDSTRNKAWIPKFVYSIEDKDLVAKTILKWREDNCDGEILIVPFFPFVFTDYSEAQSLGRCFAEEYDITSVIEEDEDIYYLIAYPECLDSTKS